MPKNFFSLFSGYGHISPSSIGGKIFTMIYALIGMPLFLLYLANIGDIMATAFKWTYRACCTFRNRRRGRKTSRYYPPPPEEMSDGAYSGSNSLYDVGVVVPMAVRFEEEEEGNNGALRAITEVAESEEGTLEGNEEEEEEEEEESTSRETGTSEEEETVTDESSVKVIVQAETEDEFLAPRQVVTNREVAIADGFDVIQASNGGSDGGNNSFYDGEVDEDPELSGSSGASSPDPSEALANVTVPITLSLVVMVSYILGGAMLFAGWEGWGFLDGSYFCFITLSTIGFGDLVPGDAMADFSGDGDSVVNVQFIFCSMYILLGMAVIAMCFNLMQEKVVQGITSFGKKVGIIKDE